MSFDFDATRPVGWMVLAVGFSILAGVSVLMALVTGLLWFVLFPVRLLRGGDQ